MSDIKNNINYKDLEKLNIINLFTSTDGIHPHTNGKLDIETLFKKNPKHDKDFIFDPYVLLNNVKKKRQKLIECYFGVFKSCCTTILSADKYGITDIIFEVPFNIPECLDYKSEDCLESIKKKLNNNGISCLKLNKSRIFITWNNLEEKLICVNNNN